MRLEQINQNPVMKRKKNLLAASGIAGIVIAAGMPLVFSKDHRKILDHITRADRQPGSTGGPPPTSTTNTTSTSATKSTSPPVSPPKNTQDPTLASGTPAKLQDSEEQPALGTSDAQPVIANTKEKADEAPKSPATEKTGTEATEEAFVFPEPDLPVASTYSYDTYAPMVLPDKPSEAPKPAAKTASKAKTASMTKPMTASMLAELQTSIKAARATIEDELKASDRKPTDDT